MPLHTAACKPQLCELKDECPPSAMEIHGPIDFVANLSVSRWRRAKAGLLARRRSQLAHSSLDNLLAHAIAEVHAELVLVHPFRDGNGRLARLLALLMALQADLPPLDFSPIAGRGRRVYIAAIHAAMGADYAPLEKLFLRIIVRSQRLAASSRR